MASGRRELHPRIPVLDFQNFLFFDPLEIPAYATSEHYCAKTMNLHWLAYINYLYAYTFIMLHFFAKYLYFVTQI